MADMAILPISASCLALYVCHYWYNRLYYC